MLHKPLVRPLVDSHLGAEHLVPERLRDAYLAWALGPCPVEVKHVEELRTKDRRSLILEALQ